MKVLRNGDTFLATRVTGPSHNLLGLDFTAGLDMYVKDLGQSGPPSVDQGSVVKQVTRALAELGVDAAELTGIQFNAQDTPSDVVYYEMAKVIIQHRRNGDVLDEFVPTWSPRNEMDSCSREEE